MGVVSCHCQVVYGRGSGSASLGGIGHGRLSGGRNRAARHPRELAATRSDDCGGQQRGDRGEQRPSRPMRVDRACRARTPTSTSVPPAGRAGGGQAAAQRRAGAHRAQTEPVMVRHAPAVTPVPSSATRRIRAEPSPRAPCRRGLRRLCLTALHDRRDDAHECLLAIAARGSRASEAESSTLTGDRDGEEQLEPSATSAKRRLGAVGVRRQVGDRPREIARARRAAIVSGRRRRGGSSAGQPRHHHGGLGEAVVQIAGDPGPLAFRRRVRARRRASKYSSRATWA